MQQRVVGRGIAGNTGEHGGLCQVKLHGGAFPRLIFQPKVDSSGSIDTIGLMAIVDTIQVHLQDILFGIVAIDLGSQDDLFELTDNRGLVADDQVFDQLLCDGAAALNDTAMGQIR